jgi:uncharacterized protein
MKTYSESGNTLSNYQTISVVVSRDCTLRCSYCYLHKHAGGSYDIDEVLASLDKLLDYYHNQSNSSTTITNGIILDFYPEPWVDIKKSNTLITEALKLLLKYPKFMDKFYISMGTNGFLLEKPIPIMEHLLDKVSVAVTVDGTKEQHDMYRVDKSGRGTWDKITKNVRTYRDKYRINGTKVTIGPDTIKYIFDACLYLWFDLGLDDVNMNVVFEDLWGDEENTKKCLIEFEEQLIKLSDYVIENKLWEKHKYVSMLGDRNIPQDNPVGETPKAADALVEDFINRSYCGAAIMRSIDTDGGVYPCFRLSPYSLNKGSPFKINENNFSEGPIRALTALNNYDAAPMKCLGCNLMGICHMCIGNAVDEVDSIYWRTTHHCEFVKLGHKYSLRVKRAMNELEPIEVNV